MSTLHHLHVSYSSSESGRAGGSPIGLQIMTASGPGSSPAIVRASGRIASIWCLESRFFGSSPGVPAGARSSEGSREKLGGRRGKLGGRRFARAVGGALRGGRAPLLGSRGRGGPGRDRLGLLRGSLLLLGQAVPPGRTGVPQAPAPVTR